MKVQVQGITGLCDAHLVRSGNCNDMVLRILVPAAGVTDEVFCERDAFRQRVHVVWASLNEWTELGRLKFVD